MTPTDSFARLRVAPDDADAWCSLDRYVRTMARARVPHLADDVASHVIERLYAKALAGLLCGPEKASAYVAAMVRNRAIDLHRRESPTSGMDYDTSDAPARQEDLDEEALALLDEAAAAVLRIRPVHHRPAFDKAWRQIRTWATSDVSLTEIIAASEGVQPGQPGWRRAQNRVHKAHRRAREAIGDRIAFLVRVGRWSEEDGDVARNGLRALVYCPHRGARRVSA